MTTALQESDTDQMVRDSARAFLEARCGFAVRPRGARPGAPDATAADVGAIGRGASDLGPTWDGMAELGWFGLGLPEEAGGLAGTPRQLLAILEEAGAVLARDPLLPNLLVAPAVLARAGDVGLTEAFVAGRARFALAGSDPRAPPLRFEGGRLSGTSGLALGAAEATHWLVAAGGDSANGAALLCVPADPAALRPVRLMDGRSAARLALDAAEVADAARLATGADALAVVAELEDRAAAGAAADGFGAAEAGFRLTLDYLKQRRQFGQSLSGFQAVQHMMADAFASLEQMRSLLVRVRADLDGPEIERARAVSAAKSFLAGRATEAVEACIQLSGGIGVTEDYRLGHVYKRVLTWNLLHGDADTHLDRLARLAPRSSF